MQEQLTFSFPIGFIYDVYQDGMCCAWGEGSYSVTTIDEEVIGEGAEFGPSESTAFTLPTNALI